MAEWVRTFCYEFFPDKTAIIVDYNKNCLGDIVVPFEVTYHGKKYAVTGIGKMAFAYVQTNEVMLPNSIKTIAEKAFFQCSLKKIQRGSMTSNNLEIAREAFLDCTMLETVSLGSNCFLNGERVFAGCRKLRNINSQDFVKKLPAGTFKDCIALTTFHFSNQLYVEDFAFENCELKKVYLQNLAYYGVDFLETIKDTKIECEYDSRFGELAYDGYNVVVDEGYELPF